MKKHLIYSLAMVGAAMLGIMGFGGGEAQAAKSVVLMPGSSAADINSAIAGLEEGDRVDFSGGVYNLDDHIEIVGKQNISISGISSTIIKYDGKTADTVGVRQAIKIIDSKNIIIEDIKVEAATITNELVWADASSGIGINSSCGISLKNVSVSGFGGHGGILVTRLDDDGAHACPAGNITFDTLTLENNNNGIFFTDGATDPADADILGVKFEGVNTIVAGNYNLNFGIASVSTGGGTVGVGVFGPDGERLNVGVLKASGFEAHHWFAVKGQIALIDAGSTLDGVDVELIETADLANDYCFELAKVIEECPEGQIPDENGDCACPEGQVMDEDGNCVCPEGYEMNEDGECVPVVPKVPDTGGGIIRDLMQSGAVWMIGIGGGVVVGSMLAVRWAKRFNRIKL